MFLKFFSKSVFNLRWRFRNHRLPKNNHKTSLVIPKHCRPEVESLEDRIAPAVITWSDSIGGSWHDPSKWDLARTPTVGDEVVIPDLIGHQTITFNSGTTTVAKITSAESLTIAAGTLRVDGELSAQSVTLTGRLEISFSEVGGGVEAGGRPCSAWEA